MSVEPINVLTLLGMLGMAVAWVYQRRRDHDDAARARAAAMEKAKAEAIEAAAAREHERAKLRTEMEDTLFTSVREEIASLRSRVAEAETDNRALREQVRALGEKLDKAEHENRQLRLYGRPEDQVRIRELEVRVKQLEEQGDK